MTSDTAKSQQHSGFTGQRVRWLLVLMIPAVFLLAWILHPDVSGRGTHRQLGLPECLLLRATGVRCPTCGMTTAFANFVRGRWSAAWQANAAGFLLAAGLVLSWPVLALSLTGRCAAANAWLNRLLPGLVMLWSVLAALRWVMQVFANWKI